MARLAPTVSTKKGPLGSAEGIRAEGGPTFTSQKELLLCQQNCSSEPGSKT
jgi:hypothetical protein